LSRFPDIYIEQNLSAIKEAILASSDAIRAGTDLSDTALSDQSSETGFVLVEDFGVVESIGPTYVREADLVSFVIDVYDHPDKVVEGNLTYYQYVVDDITRVDYIYEYAYGDYLILSTRFQSLTNIDRTLTSLGWMELTIQGVVILLLSALISYRIARPLRRINAYAKDISSLQFDRTLSIRRNDEFRDLVTVLNEMSHRLKQAYDDLQEANASLTMDLDDKERRDAQKQRFLMAINHELKTPIAVMRGMVEGMIDNVGRYRDHEAHLPELLRQMETMERITNDLTFRLRLEDKISPSDASSTAVIRSEAEALQHLARSYGRSLVVQVEDAILPMQDELLRMLVTNLLKNAITHANGKTVSIDGTVHGSRYVLTVRNRGVIPKDDLPRVFDSFYRGSSEASGSGLGLFIVKEICAIYEFDVAVFNDSGHVVAKVTIPIPRH
jgi:two-component system sensor histidine kinase VanS